MLRHRRQPPKRPLWKPPSPRVTDTWEGEKNATLCGYGGGKSMKTLISAHLSLSLSLSRRAKGFPDKGEVLIFFLPEKMWGGVFIPILLDPPSSASCVPSVHTM